VHPGRWPFLFLGLVFGLGLPLWFLSEELGVLGAMRIPVADLALGFVPAAAALLLSAVEQGRKGPAALLRRSLDPCIRGQRWVAATLLLAPAIYLLVVVLMRAIGHPSAAGPDLLQLSALLVLFLLLAAGEEIGWTGYATAPLQARFGAVGAALVIAVPWWLAHLPSMLAVGATGGDIAWWVLGAIGLRVLMVWLHNNAGQSTFAVIVFHALLNTGRIATYPAIGAHYDPLYQATGHWVAFGLAVLVTLVWGWRTLARSA
jgi:membrane protease YdiL (CAAX protease family)